MVKIFFKNKGLIRAAFCFGGATKAVYNFIALVLLEVYINFFIFF